MLHCWSYAAKIRDNFCKSRCYQASKLSHLMSYPVGAGKLSQVLADVQQINDLSVAFFASCQNPSKLENLYRILNVDYFYANREEHSVVSSYG